MTNGILDVNKVGNAYLVVDLIPKSNTTSRPQHSMTPKYITVHNTGNGAIGADAESNSAYVDTATSYVSWHFTVDDKYIFQELPVNEVAFHAGDGNGDGNYKSIGIEICENIDGDYKKAQENAIQLIRYLIRELNIDVENVVPHKHWSGKHCPHIILDSEKGWDGFMIEVKGAINQEEVSEWAKEAWQWAIENKINDGAGAKNNVTEEQLMVFLKRYHDAFYK